MSGSVTDRTIYVPCECSDAAHVIKFYRDTDPEWNECGVSVQMNHHLPWWKRVGVAFKYVLGQPTRNHWHDACWSDDERREVAAFLSDDPAPWVVPVAGTNAQ